MQQSQISAVLRWALSTLLPPEKDGEGILQDEGNGFTLTEKGGLDGILGKEFFPGMDFPGKLWLLEIPGNV